MSAWIVSKHHIDAMLTAWVKLRGRDGGPGGGMASSYGRPDEIGQMLWQENHASVGHRYRQEVECPQYTWAEVPWPVEPDAETLATVCKLVNCYTYQSCEHDEWETSTASKFCDTLIGYVCRNLPGYEEAPWGIDSEERNVFFVTRKKGS